MTPSRVLRILVAAAAVLAKRRHLEDFIARNKARAATAGLAQSKAKALEKLETVEIVGDEPTASIRAPRVEPRALVDRVDELRIGLHDLPAVHEELEAVRAVRVFVVPAREGERLGIDTPVNRALTRLVHALEAREAR